MSSRDYTPVQKLNRFLRRREIRQGRKHNQWLSSVLPQVKPATWQGGSFAVYQELDMQQGSVFPAQPATGQVFFRTDLGYLCYFTGTRWLTSHEFSYTPAGLTTGTNATLVIGKVRTDFAIFITRVSTLTRVSTTNDGSNFWTIDYDLANTLLTATSDIHIFNTSTYAPDVYTENDSPPNQPPNPTNRTLARVSVFKTLAAGVIVIYPTVYYRLIVT